MPKLLLLAIAESCQDLPQFQGRYLPSRAACGLNLGSWFHYLSAGGSGLLLHLPEALLGGCYKGQMR